MQAVILQLPETESKTSLRDFARVFRSGFSLKKSPVPSERIDEIIVVAVVDLLLAATLLRSADSMNLRRYWGRLHPALDLLFCASRSGEMKRPRGKQSSQLLRAFGRIWGARERASEFVVLRRPFSVLSASIPS